jgi:hypothetical protein
MKLSLKRYVIWKVFILGALSNLPAFAQSPSPSIDPYEGLPGSGIFSPPPSPLIPPPPPEAVPLGLSISIEPYHHEFPLPPDPECEKDASGMMCTAQLKAKYEKISTDASVISYTEADIATMVSEISNQINLKRTTKVGEWATKVSNFMANPFPITMGGSEGPHANYEIISKLEGIHKISAHYIGTYSWTETDSNNPSNPIQREGYKYIRSSVMNLTRWPTVQELYDSPTRDIDSSSVAPAVGGTITSSTPVLTSAKFTYVELDYKSSQFFYEGKIPPAPVQTTNPTPPPTPAPTPWPSYGP